MDRHLRAAALLALALAAGCTKEQPKGPTAAELLEFGVDRAPGKPAPPFQLQTLEGKPFSLADAKGKVVFVNFWATWCPPCRDEMPSMVALGRELETKYPDKFKMVAVSVDDGWQPVREFFAAPPYGGNAGGMTVGLDEEQKTTVAYYCAARGGCPDAYKFPESYIVDKQGRLVSFVVGPRNWARPVARAYLEALIRN